jgi:hypothetical protein
MFLLPGGGDASFLEEDGPDGQGADVDSQGSHETSFAVD